MMRGTGSTLTVRTDASCVRPSDSPSTLREVIPLFLSHGSPQILIACILLALAVRIEAGNGTAWGVAPIAGLLLFWPLQESLIHVFILHTRPKRVFGRNIDFRVPRKPREHPRDLWCLHLPFGPVHSLVYSVPLRIGIGFAAGPSTPLALTGITAHFVLALHPGWVHCLVHTRVPPRHGDYQRLRSGHRRHHCNDEHCWFGVTMLAADHLLGTALPLAAVPTSATARNLDPTALDGA